MPTRSRPASAAQSSACFSSRRGLANWLPSSGRAGAKLAPLLAALGADRRRGAAGECCLVRHVSAKLHLFRRAARHRGNASIVRLTAGWGRSLWILGIAAIATKFIAAYVDLAGASIDFLAQNAFSWLGLASRKPNTEDFVPLFPRLGLMWWGMAAGN